MKRIHFFFLVIILVSSWIISCNKEYSLEDLPFENSDALGTFVTDTSGLCDKAFVNGTYYIGSNLDSSHYALVYVNVASVGKYNIKTNVSNGIYYLDSGYFYKTGIQQVQLMAHGVPLVPDTTLFAFTFGNSSCLFKVTKIIDTTSKPTNAYFKLLGSPLNCSNIVLHGNYTVGASLDTSHYIIAQVNAITTGFYQINTNIINGFSYTTSGTFTQKGIQPVKLFGSGKPQKIGTNTFALISSTGDCNFDVKTN